MRPSEAQKKILEILDASREPLSATALGKRLHPTHKTTVYRALDALVGNGDISTIRIAGTAMYELSKGSHHHHAICIGCKKIEHIPAYGIEKAEQGAYKQKGFVITGHAVEFSGTCAECAKK